jgi:hypothetical protein
MTVDDYAAEPVSLAFPSNESIAETERAQARREGNVPLGPGGGVSDPVVQKDHEHVVI